MPLRRHLVPALSLGLLALTALFPSLASAGEAHLFKETLGGAAGPSFVKATGLAVDQASGDLLVIDEEASTVSRFKPNGEADDFSELGTNVIDGKGGKDKTPQEGLQFVDPRFGQIAVDNSGGPSDGDIYVTQYENHLVDVFDSSGEYLGQLSEFKEGPAAEGAPKPLGKVCGVAVDSAGAVYLGDLENSEIHKYLPAASPVANADSKANLEMPSVCTLSAGSGSSAGSLFAYELNSNGGEGHILKLDAGTGEVKYTVLEEKSMAQSVDPSSGHLYVVPFEFNGDVKDFDAAGASKATLLDTFFPGGPGGVVLGVAIDAATHDVYVSRGGNHQIEVWETVPRPEAITEAATEIGATAATLHGKAGAEGGPPASCEFEYTTEARFKAEGFKGALSASCVPGGPFTGSSLEAVSAHVEGLTPGAAYRFRAVADNGKASQEGEALSFRALGPTIASEAFSQVTTSAAQITATVNPNGKATAFAVQYTTEAAFKADREAAGDGFTGAEVIPVPPQDIGSGSSPVAVSQQLSGLSPETAYRFRLVASNADATSHGDDLAFSTYPTPPPALPDSRAYELVSPPQKVGEVLPPDPGGILSGSCTECLPGINDLRMPMQARPDGDAVAYEGQPFSGGFAVGANEYQATRSSSGWATSDLSGASFATPRVDGQSGFKGFSEDLSRGVLWQGEPALSEDAPLGPGGRPFANLYLWEEGALRPLVSSEPPHRAPGVQGNTSFIPVYAGANSGAAGAPAFSHVVFEANDALTEEVAGVAPGAPAVGPSACLIGGEKCDLYEWFDGELRLVNVLPGNTAAVAGAVIGSGRQLGEGVPQAFNAPNVDHAISADGSHIFWSSEAGQVYVRIDGEETLELKDHAGRYLTASTDGSKALLNDGCLYSLAKEECEAQIGQAASFKGILGAADDLSRVYFVDKAALTGSEANANGEEAQAGAFNLYAWSGGATKFIGRLLGGEIGDNAIAGGSLGAWKASRPNRTAQVTPDGRYLAFMSRARLTGAGGICKGNSSGACYETFEYDAAAGRLTCVSCNPTGAGPLGQSNLSLIAITNGAPFPQPHNLPANGEGRLFFESQDTLSPKDTNGRIQDVYEWEPNGVGSCEKAGGCVFLISSGHSPNDSMFVDATPSGDDAFFITREKLLGADRNEQLDLYDARVGGGIAEDIAPPCAGQACRGPGTLAPSEASAGSAAFAGPPNPKPKHAKKKKHGKRHKKHLHHHKRR